jgi:hypothetical protein
LGASFNVRLNILQRLVVPTDARSKEASLTMSLGVSWVSRNGGSELGDLGVEIAFDRSFTPPDITTPA